MININKVKIFNKYHDIDDWARSGSKSDKLNITDNEWGLIENLVEETFLVINKLTSKTFEENLKENLLRYCDNNLTIEEIYSIAKRRNPIARK